MNEDHPPLPPDIEKQLREMSRADILAVVACLGGIAERQMRAGQAATQDELAILNQSQQLLLRHGH